MEGLEERLADKTLEKVSEVFKARFTRLSCIALEFGILMSGVWGFVEWYHIDGAPRLEQERVLIFRFGNADGALL